ncbi:Variant-specific surface protein, partial [Giardia duodenalis]
VNDPAGVSVDGLCRPSSSSQAIMAGCAGKDGAALTDSSTACGMCSGEFFLFMGGCYSTKSNSGSEICTAAEGGKCTACKTDGSYIFQNPADAPTLGSECILCSDTTNRDGVMGVANCNKCTAPDSAGAATYSACQEGFYKDTNGTCAQCDTNSCLTCETSATQCTSCPKGKYLNGNTCAASCGNDKYADKQSGQCKACSTIDANCGTCEYNEAAGKGRCLTCTAESDKIPRTAVDGTSTCVAKDYNGCKGADGAAFITDDKSACLLCSDTSVDDTKPNDRGVTGCKACEKSSAAPPSCSACLPGYFFETGTKTCTLCKGNCEVCGSGGEISTCTKCLPGFFLKSDGGKACIPCDSTTEGGSADCQECTNVGTFKCTKCKPNYQQSGPADSVICTKACEDDSACGGTAGSCDAIVISASGEMTYYCSLCADNSQYPIDGLCVDNSKKGNNQCSNGVCTSCTTNYFLYMGGCYSTASAPGSLMCTTAKGGICTTVANNKYFAVPGAKATDQSVLGCGNPLGTTVGDNAYVGVEGCRTCTAPSALSSAGMTAAKCTACDEGKALTGSGYGCVTCGDGHRLEGDTCVRTGANLSTGAMAGISVTKSSPALYH